MYENTLRPKRIKTRLYDRGKMDLEGEREDAESRKGAKFGEGMGIKF